MRMLNKSAVCVALATALVTGGLLGPLPAKASTVLNFDLETVSLSPHYSVFGTITITGGLITAFNAVVNGPDVTNDATTLAPPPPLPAFSFDNVWNAADPHLSTPGMGFTAGLFDYNIGYNNIGTPGGISSGYYLDRAAHGTNNYSWNNPMDATLQVSDATSQGSETPLPAARL
jgi:hypothetical protein